MNTLKVGLIGCGMISDIYLKNCNQVFRAIDIVGCADLLFDKATEKAEKYGIKAYTIDELLLDSDIDIILNLTIPNSHFEISKKILEAGKHLYSEKPLATRFEDGCELVKIAAQKQLKIGCAPDTFLGSGIQTAKKIIDDGWIGKPIAANAFMMARGPESFHPNPEFFYQHGGGPLFDMGPYYLTALVSLLGDIDKVAGMAKITSLQKMITGEKRYGEIIPVETPTHIASLLSFNSGVTASLTTSFDMQYPYWESKLPFIEIYGTEGSMSVPDPNKYEGPVKLRRGGEFIEIPLTDKFTENLRGMGLADLASAIINDRKERASGDLALHVLEAMHGILQSSESGVYYQLTKQCERPQGLPIKMPKYLF